MKEFKSKSLDWLEKNLKLSQIGQNSLSMTLVFLGKIFKTSTSDWLKQPPMTIIFCQKSNYAK